MPFTVDGEQRKFFRTHHYIAFDDLLSPEDCTLLEKEGSFDQIKSINRRRQLAEIASQLIEKRPLRLFSFGTEMIPLEEEHIGLLIDLSSGRVYYFETVDFPLPHCYRLLVLTTRYLGEERHPLLFR